VTEGEPLGIATAPSFGHGDYARAVLNILEDFGEEKTRLEATQRAVLNILDDFTNEKERLEETQRAVLNILEDLDVEKRTALEANRLKSEFLANMSHELRTPLNAIIGFAKLMYHGKVGPVSSQHREFLGDILSSSDHLLQLINDVLDLAKIEAGRMVFHPEPVDLVALVGEVVDTLRAVAAAKQIRIRTAIDGDCRELVLDPSKLKQVLYNYLSNALKFSAEGGAVQVRARPEGPERFRIEVEDFGIGIAPEDLPLLFREFRQLDSSASKKYQGTGLGLALTRRIVEAQGGSVAVCSERGKGSVFAAVLPRTPCADAVADRVITSREVSS
jgi:signal transduction histidine kinase